MLNFSDKTVFVIGDLMLDEYVLGKDYKMSDEAPIPILKVDRFDVFLGGAANVAHNILALGATPILCGIIGGIRKDLLYGHSTKRFMSLLESKSMSSNWIIHHNGITTTKTRIIINNYQVARYDYEDNVIDDDTTNRLCDKIKYTDFRNIDIVIVSDYRKGVVNQDVMDLLRTKTDNIFVDPKPGNDHYYHDIVCMTPNRRELLEMTGENDITTAARILIKRHNLSHIIVTMGDQGAFYCSENEAEFVPGHKTEIANTIGAGDTFIAAYALSVCSGKTPSESTAIANLACRIVVSKPYTSVCSIEEINSTDLGILKFSE